jgi:hypothetical protein
LSFAAITLCVDSQRVIPKVSVNFVIDSVRKLLSTSSRARAHVRTLYIDVSKHIEIVSLVNGIRDLKLAGNAVFEVFTAVKVQVTALWVVTPCGRYQRFGGLCCLHLQGEVGRCVVLQLGTIVSGDVSDSIFRVKFDDEHCFGRVPTFRNTSHPPSRVKSDAV